MELNDLIVSFLRMDVDRLLYSLKAVRYERLRLVSEIDRKTEGWDRGERTQFAPGDPRNDERNPRHADSALTRQDALFRYPQISKKKAFKGPLFKGILYYPVLVKAFKREIWDCESTYLRVATTRFEDVVNGYSACPSLQVRCMPETAIEAGIRKLLYSFYSIPATVSDFSRRPNNPSPEYWFLKAPFIPPGFRSGGIGIPNWNSDLRVDTSKVWQSSLRIEPSKWWRDHIRLIDAVRAEEMSLPRNIEHFVAFQPNEDQRQSLLRILPELERTKQVVYALANEVLHPDDVGAFETCLPPRRRRKKPEYWHWTLRDRWSGNEFNKSNASAMDLQTDIDNFGLAREQCFGVLAEVEAFLQKILDVENVVWRSPMYDDYGICMDHFRTTCVQEHLTWLRAQKAACVKAWSELGAILHEHASSLLADGASPWNV